MGLVGDPCVPRRRRGPCFASSSLLDVVLQDPQISHPASEARRRPGAPACGLHGRRPARPMIMSMQQALYA